MPVKKKPSPLEIKKTDKYSLFEKHGDNRKLKLSKHRKLTRSMEEFGFLPYWPVVVGHNGNGKFKIFDGQHRVEIAQSLGLPVYYIISDIEFNIATINDTQRTWDTIDYAEVYAEKGIRAYQDGLAFMQEHNIAIGQTFALLAGVTSYSNVENSFKQGNFRVKDFPWAEKVVGVFCPIRAMTAKINRSAFLQACMSTCRVNYFDISRMVTSAEKQRDKLESFSTRDAYLDMMETIYNHGRQAKNTRPLKFDSIETMRKRSGNVGKKK